MTISRVITRLVEEYDEHPVDINSGNCEAFADDVALAVPGARAVWDWEADPDQEEYVWCHCFIEYEGRYYDAECPEGVKDWRQLPFFNASSKARKATKP